MPSPKGDIYSKPKGKDAATSTNRDAITPDMRENYRLTLREKAHLIEEIKRVQELIRQGGTPMETMKSEYYKQINIVASVRSDRQEHQKGKQQEKRLKEAIVVTPLKEPVAVEEEEVEQDKVEYDNEQAKEKIHIAREKKIREAAQREEAEMGTATESALLYARNLHMEIAAMHAAIQQRECLAGAFITLLIILILFF